LRTSANINNTLVTLLLLSVFSIAHDIISPYIGGRTRRTNHYSNIDGTPSLVNRKNSRVTLYAKSIFNFALFVGVQSVITRVVIETAATQYHTFLNAVSVICLLCLIRSLKLHVNLPVRTRPIDYTNYSPGFVALQKKCQRMAQTVLAIPTTIVALHSHVSREAMWKHAWFLSVLAGYSLVIFLAGNVAVLLAGLPVQ